jgi:hypothetical protein
MRELVSPDVIHGAVETYNLEISLGGLDKEALGKAISAALVLHERTVLTRAAAVLESLADATEETGEDDAEAQAFGMRWGASKLRDDIALVAGKNDSYIIGDGDIVEILLTGPVEIIEEACGNCGHEAETMYYVTDDATGATYFFDERELKGRLRVRTLFRQDSDNAE